MMDIFQTNNSDHFIEYTKNYKFHRANGPAVVYDGWYWMLNGQYHRYYGPYSAHDIWYIHGKVVK